MQSFHSLPTFFLVFHFVHSYLHAFQNSYVSKQSERIKQSIRSPATSKVGVNLVASSNNYSNDDDTVNVDEDEINFDEITDEQILLACRSYLQKRNELEWTQAKRRKQGSQLMESRRQGEDGGGVGYFWENMTELKYLHSTNCKYLEDMGDDNSDSEENTEPKKSDVIKDVEDSYDDPSDPMNIPTIRNYELSSRSRSEDAFATYSKYPSEEHENRSRAAKEMWASPGFRKRWYAKRWGDESPYRAVETLQQKQKSRDMQKIQNFPSDLLLSEVFSTMSEKELKEAVAMYICENKKRSLSLKKKNRGGLRKWVKEEIEGGEIKFQESISEDSLREHQKIRSERAKKAYQTRLENIKLKEKKKRKGNKEKKNKSYAKSLSSLILSSVENPPQNQSNKVKIQQKEAMIQIEKCVDNGEFPSSVDVHFVLSATRLAGRRPLLLRILKDCFGLYGKCIPGDPSLGANSKMLFASKCNLDVLGSFIVEKLEEKELSRANL